MYILQKQQMKQLLILLAIFSPFVVFGQNEAIKNIRERYQKATSAIKLAESGEQSGLYCNTIEENKYNGSWRAVGLYNIKTEFWYDDQPGMLCEEEGKGEACHLQFIKNTAQVSAGGWYTEYLFQDGKLLFVFMETEGAQYRFYWHNEKLIRIQVDDEILTQSDPDMEETAKDHWKEGQKYRKWYLTLF